MITLRSTSQLKSLAATGLIGCSFAALVIYLVIIGGNRQALDYLTFTN